MGKLNMVGMDAEARPDLVARSNAFGCLVLAAVLLMGCLAAGGWLVYLACLAWPVLCDRLPPIGFVALGAAAQMVWSGRRKGR